MTRDPGLHEHAKDEIIERNGRDLTVLAIATGVVILACHLESGSRRWAAAIWTSALDIPGAPATWGVVILAAGLLMLRGRRRDSPTGRRRYRAGCVIGSAWFSMIAFFWASSILIDLVDRYVMHNPAAGVANPFGIPMCLYIAVMMARRARLANEHFYG